MIKITKAKYYALLEVVSIMLIIAGAIISHEYPMWYDVIGWQGAIITLVGILGYIGIADMKDKESSK